MRLLTLALCAAATIFASAKTDESTIPVVDLQEYFNLDTREKFLDEVREALHTTGFFGVKNTGSNAQIIDNLYSAIDKFYHLDPEVKREIYDPSYCGQKGFVPGETAKGNILPDLKEFFMMGRDLPMDQMKMYNLIPNVWPTSMNLQEPATKFFNHIEEYSILFQEIFSLALGQEKDFFKNLCDFGDSSCRMIYYPYNKNQEQPEDGEERIWAGAHTDITLFTILPKSTGKGLEAMDKDGVWQPIYMAGDGFVINGGDILELFSNGYFRSAMHRVKKPKDMKEDRYSSVFFVHPRLGATVYPLENMIEQTGGEAKYITATHWEMLMERLADLEIASDDMLKELAEKRVLERLMEVNRASRDAMNALYKAGYASDEIKKALNK